MIAWGSITLQDKISNVAIKNMKLQCTKITKRSNSFSNKKIIIIITNASY